MQANPITNVKAVQGNKGPDWTLKVEGEITIYSGGTFETEDVDDGFNPTIALFRVTAYEAGGPIKGIPTHFSIERTVEPGRYSQVTINLGEENSVTSDIVEVKTVS